MSKPINKALISGCLGFKSELRAVPTTLMRGGAKSISGQKLPPVFSSSCLTLEKKKKKHQR